MTGPELGLGAPIDFTKKLREHRASRRAACKHERVSVDRKGFEVCVSCADTFPCRSGCGHVDCLIRREELGVLVAVRDNELPRGLVVTDRGTGKVEFDTSDDDPAEWLVPGVRCGG